MSQNHWETQPRKDNGEFTFRYEFWKEQLKAMAEMDENPEVSQRYDGGSYYELRKKYSGNQNIEVHHMPADSASNLPKGKGPCIAITKNDHKRTSSYKNYKKSRRFRRRQKFLVDNNRFLEAQEMDFKNLRRQFNSKYAKAMLEKLEYDKKLYDQGVIHG